MKTSLNKIREHSPCAAGWGKLLKRLGKTQADDEELSLLTILESNGLDDALWCIRAVDNCNRDARLYAVWCARQVQHFMTDQRSLDALDVAERYANGQATDRELAAACAWARDAARDAAWARAAARDAAWARAAARDAAWAMAAARDAAWDAARDAAWDAARAAARDAAWAAAAWDAAACASAWDAAACASAWDAAWDAAMDSQKDMFIKMCKGEAPWQKVEVE